MTKHSKVTKGSKSKEKTLIVAVDVGKDKNTGRFRCPDGTESRPLEFGNNARGFKRVWRWILEAKKTYGLKEVVVGFESTGPYGEPFAQYFLRKPVQLVQVNPMHTKRIKELADNSPNKTDRKDPRVIADIIQLGHTLSLVVPEGPAADLRRLTQAREKSIQTRTSLSNQLQQLVFVLFPEFLQVMKGITSKSAFFLLKHYPTAQDILECGPEALASILRKVSRGKLREDRARTLFEAAETSVGVLEGRVGLLMDIKHTLSAIEGQDRFIATVEKEMSEKLKDIPYSWILLSIKGIGTVTAAGLIGEVGDFRKFRTVGEITKLAGLNLFVISSGKRTGQRRTSKRGRSLMRKLLYFASLNVVGKGRILHGYYQRCLERGMPRMKALTAISRKLLRIIFAMVRDHRGYDSSLMNQETELKEVA